MGKYFWMKRVDDEKHHKQQGCMFSLAHVLGYHFWKSSTRKKIQHHMYEGQRDDRRDQSHKRRLFQHDDDETENLLDENGTRYPRSRRSTKTEKRSQRRKSLITEDKENVPRKGGSSKGNLQRTYSIHHLESLDADWKHPIILLPETVDNRTHQSQDATKTKSAGSQEATRGRSSSSQQYPDVLDMFAVDKGMLIKHLRGADENVAKISRSALGLTEKATLSKSRSFPMPNSYQRRKLKPVKLESKQNEVWSYPRKSKFRSVSQVPTSDHSDFISTISGELDGDVESNGALGGDTIIKQDTQTNNDFAMPSDLGPNTIKSYGISLAGDDKKTSNQFLIRENIGEIGDGKSENAISRSGQKPDDNDTRKYGHHRSSLKESLEKYARLFENSFQADVKLNSSKSLKVANEYGHGPAHIRRILSLSNVDFYHLTSSFEALGDDPNGNGSIVTTKATGSGLPNSEEENIVSLHASDISNILDTSMTATCQKEPADTCNSMQLKEEDDACLSFLTSDVDREKMQSLKEEELKSKKSYLLEETNCSENVQMQLLDQVSILDSDVCLQEAEACAVLQYSEDLESESSVNIFMDSSKMENLQDGFLSTHSTAELKNDEISDKSMCSYACNKSPKMNGSDLCYVRNLLDKSGIAVDASEMSWHASDKPFSPELFEEEEACWPHEQDQLTGWPHFYGCWHHRMLFDLLNEVTLEVYDISLPYYPKALSSTCQVRPFPAGARIIEELSMITDRLLTLKHDEMQLLDSIVAFDMSHNCSWMNLQTETECVALELEDMIFDEVLEEIMLS